MAWNTSQLLTMVHLNKKHRSWILRTTALNQPWFDGMFYLFMNGWKSFLQSRQPNNRCFCFQGQLEKDHVPLKLSASGCVQNVLSWGVNSKFAAWKRKPVMNIDESWEFRATVYSMFKSMFFSFFTIRTTAVSTERCYCGVGPKGNGVLPSRGSSGDPNAILIRWKWVVRWTTGGTIDRNTQLRITAIILQLNSWKVTCRRGIVWASDWQSSASCSASSVKQSYSHNRKKNAWNEDESQQGLTVSKLGTLKSRFDHSSHRIHVWYIC